MSDALAPGSTIGILGGGQLGRMLALAAAPLGFKVHIYEPSADCPAAQVADRCTTAPYDDDAALDAFAASVNVVTYEFENVPTAALDRIEAVVPIRPNRRSLGISQDRLDEKTFLQGIGLKTAPFANVEDQAELDAAISQIGTPSILKTRRMGYDGKGQARLRSADDRPEVTAPSVLEGFVDFSAEISVIAARALDGAITCYDPGENVHRDGILATTTVPASLPRSLQTDAVLLAGRILNELDYVGVMGIELFVTSGGLIVNEIAPRVHNSGHWTQNGCTIDQFEQHIRAVAGWPLGDGQRHSDVVMENLIGDEVDQWQALSADSNAALHLYGKAQSRPGRKMGHVNRVSPRASKG
ncbi:5-(carboxyamino)imidazole ribonucleotide synthase [Pontivivens insulae]|uniref:N5-carboxyaminoimidazole ribonucleotide synthase n=1 Tax=Pontivivens insulae TaxID=1639689 RepID=A0A2R8A6E1_9RHOB|nr:5-(carboxyamino)imidazole ribonucleotide synthase [Pontivivens insulae]RED17918.1 5-(carboxyamino)imidazole ribonucleotide synthase [Pontivivens insulae]SPF27807.1 N5-carboxyaminoimidazole ribonucleotide synthase [Pontivivens insulae]